MPRLVIIIAASLVAAFAIPKFYQDNPELFEKIGKDESSSNTRKITISRAERTSVSNPLSGRKVRLEMDSRGHFVSDFKLNGRTVNALVDTGATYVAINAKTARRIGIRLTPSDYKYTVNTANGQVKAAAGKIDEIRIGRVRVANVEAAILPDRALSSTLIGMSFLKQLDSFEVEGNTLILQQ